MAHVLVIDDDAHFRALARAALEEMSLKVVEASKGRDGLQLLREDAEIEVIVVDGLLPDTNGIKWIERIREDGVRLPVVFISAFFRDLVSFRKLTTELDVAEVIHKPIDMEQFARRIRRLVPRRRRTSMTIDLSELQSHSELTLDDIIQEDERPSASFLHDTSKGTERWLTSPPETNASLSGPSVFVLSDDVALIEYVRSGLAEALLRVEGATTLATVLPSESPDIVILGLPFGRPGEASLAVERLSVGGTRPRIAVLAVDDGEPTRLVAEEIDADMLLTHPVEADDLSAALVHLEGLADPAPPRVLVWSKGDAARCADELAPLTVSLRREDTWEKLHHALKQWNPHAVVVDASDVGHVRRIRMSEGGARPALIVVGPALIEPAILAGASNVLHDPSCAEVVASLALRTRLRLRAADDPLTRMPRRAKATRNLLARAAETRRTKQPFAFAFVAMDGQATLRSRVGEEAATDADRAFASLLRARFRIEDIRVRWTRDAYAIAFPRTRAEDIEAALGRLQDDCKRMRFEGENGDFRVSFCAGVATLGAEGEECETFEELTELAELRLRAAQAQGSGQILVR
ncbi:MAG: response regulator [Polyangiales bacterium]